MPYPSPKFKVSLTLYANAISPILQHGFRGFFSQANIDLFAKHKIRKHKHKQKRKQKYTFARIKIPKGITENDLKTSYT